MQTSLPEIFYWVATTYLENIGPVRLRRWLQHFENIKNIFTASLTELQSAGLTEKQIHSIKYVDWHAVERDIKWSEKNHCHLISYQDSFYPLLLREINDAPLLLYVRGNKELLSQAQIAIVGSRNPTTPGKEIAERFARCLTQAGLIVTSGMALGIDAASHKGALSTEGKTIAVMGTGLKNIYPKSHHKLAERIITNGALISEFPPAVGPKSHNFPLRNRIISGMSLGVLVVEAAVKSGSLITARFALEQNREVFAIPGSIHNPLARGCHELIRQGAKLVEKAEDILEELGALQAVVSVENNLQKKFSEHQLFIQHIGYETTALDTIIHRSGMPAEEVSSLLLTLELEDLVVSGSGGYMRK